jgi:RNA polymerase sigma-70 factor (ECF subfamily)
VSNLLDEWAPRVYRFALRLCNDRHAAEDLTQETLLRAWRQRGRLRDPRAFQVWLFRIAVNLWNDQLRRGRSPVASASPLAGDETGQAQPADRLVAGREELECALRVMAALPPRQREVLYLSACEGLSSCEVAEILGISTDAAKANLALARKKVRQQLPDLCPDPSPASNSDS